MPIKIVVARQIFDATGIPTVEVDLVTELGLFRIGVPSTDVKKSAEAVQLRDNHPVDYRGMGVLGAVKYINTVIGPELIKMNLEVVEQKDIDNFLISLDGTDNRSRLGANSIMAVSLVVAKAGAAKKGVPLYRHLSDLSGTNTAVLPVPHFTVLCGGLLSTNGLPFQEFTILPTGATSFQEAIKMGTEIYHEVKQMIINKYGPNSAYASDCGGFSIPLSTTRDAVLLLSDSIRQCGYLDRVEIGINASAGAMFKDGAYDLDFKNPTSNPQDCLTVESLIEYYLDLMKEFPVRSVDDPFDLDDWGSFITLTGRVSPGQVVTNDLSQTNAKRIFQVADKKAGTACALRLNQCSTLSEILDCVKVLKEANLGIVCTDRFGDTNDTFLADLAVGISAGQIKCGGPARGNSIDKYNQVLRIEEELGAMGTYAGRNLGVSG